MWSNRLPAINCGHFHEVVKRISSLFIWILVFFFAIYSFLLPRVPKRFSAFFIVIYNSLWFFSLKSDYFLVLLFPLFPCTPMLSVVLHMVREPFLTRCSKTAVAWSEGLFFMFRFVVLSLRWDQEARCFFKPGVSIFNTPIQRIRVSFWGPGALNFAFLPQVTV